MTPLSPSWLAALLGVLLAVPQAAPGADSGATSSQERGSATGAASDAGSARAEGGNGEAQDAEAESGEPAESAQEKRRRQFRETLTESVLEGTWQMTVGDGIDEPVKMTAPRPEKYTISRVEHAGDDNWVITARIQYADKDVEVPVLVKVRWLEEMPVIVVDNMPIPMIGTYSARVMIHGGFYAGTWFGKGYGGVLSGKIRKAKDERKAAPEHPEPR